MKQKKRQQGFTLIELMAVVAILAILATIAIPSVVGAVERGRAGTNQANRAALEQAIRRYHVQEGAWPSTADNALTRGIPTAIVTQGFFASIPAISGMAANTNWVLEFRNPNDADWQPWTALTVPDRRRGQIRVLLPEDAPGFVADP